MTLSQKTFYLPVAGGECFCIYRSPVDSPVRQTLLHLPAFGDEMNKARSMTARAARAFAAHGCAVLQFDLFGCGDSSGAHGDATPAEWCENARAAVEWLKRTNGSGPDWLWCLRSGALIASSLLENGAADASLLLWHPVLSGAQQLGLVLRQAQAVDLLAAEEERSSRTKLRERLRAGETIEVGGYAISSAMAEQLETCMFKVPESYSGRIGWFEVTSSPTPSLAPTSERTIQGLRARGIVVSTVALRGPTFWQSTEIEHCAELISASVSALGADNETSDVSGNSSHIRVQQ